MNTPKYKTMAKTRLTPCCGTEFEDLSLFRMKKERKLRRRRQKKPSCRMKAELNLLQK